MLSQLNRETKQQLNSNSSTLSEDKVYIFSVFIHISPSSPGI